MSLTPPAYLSAPLLTSSTVASLAASKLFSLVRLLVHLFVRLGLSPRWVEIYFLRKAREYNAKVHGLSPPDNPDITVTVVDTPVTPAISLKGTLFLPHGASFSQRCPAICIRTPYDRRNPILGSMWARMFAERGFACLVQDTRGRFGSGGVRWVLARRALTAE
jgi:hypothetical protein